MYSMCLCFLVHYSSSCWFGIKALIIAFILMCTNNYTAMCVVMEMMLVMGNVENRALSV